VQCTIEVSPTPAPTGAPAALLMVVDRLALAQVHRSYTGGLR
jgi:hypothetical protein